MFRTFLISSLATVPLVLLTSHVADPDPTEAMLRQRKAAPDLTPELARAALLELVRSGKVPNTNHASTDDWAKCPLEEWANGHYVWGWDLARFSINPAGRSYNYDIFPRPGA